MISYNRLKATKTPDFSKFEARPTVTQKNIFRINKNELQLFFLSQNIKEPDNTGECRVSLNMLAECGYNDGLCALLNTDPDTGIIGDQEDIERRIKQFGGHQIALPKIQSFFTLLARQFEDTNVIFLIWSATIYLVFTMFSKT